MNNETFWIHDFDNLEPKENKYRGFTAEITRTNKRDENRHQTCEVKVAFCSGKDNFCRRTGREKAAEKQAVTMNVVNLPSYLKQTCIKSLNLNKNVLEFCNPDLDEILNFDYVLRNFV